MQKVKMFQLFTNNFNPIPIVKTAATAASFTSWLIKSTHSNGVERPHTPPRSIRPISPVLPPLKFDEADRPGRWGGSTSKWGGSTMRRIDRKPAR